MEGFVEQVHNLHGRHMPKLQMLSFSAHSWRVVLTLFLLGLMETHFFNGLGQIYDLFWWQITPAM